MEGCNSVRNCKIPSPFSLWWVGRSTKNPDFYKLSPVDSFIPIGKKSKAMQGVLWKLLFILWSWQEKKVTRHPHLPQNLVTCRNHWTHLYRQLLAPADCWPCYESASACRSHEQKKGTTRCTYRDKATMNYPGTHLSKSQSWLLKHTTDFLYTRTH